MISLLLLLPVLGLASWVLSRWMRSKRPITGTWRSMQSESIPFRYYATFEVNEPMLVARVNSAYAALLNFGPWRAAKLWAALANVNIWVVNQATVPPTQCTPREAATTLSGPLTRTDIRIGRSLETLCHELAHMAEAKVDLRIDRSHTSWSPRGIARALLAYGETV